jgi:hypothetical protein
MHMATKAGDTPQVLAVLASFVGNVGGEDIDFRQGELIEADHPAVKKWPESFGAVRLNHPVKRSASVEQATAAPGEKRGG